MKKLKARIYSVILENNKIQKTSVLPLMLGFLLLSMQPFAQSNTKPCRCSLLLQESVQRVSSIYAGFDDKVTAKTRSEYNHLVTRLKQASLKAQSEWECYEVIKQYTDWFKDSHVGIWYGVKRSATQVRRINLADALKKAKAGTTGLEGLWSTADGKQQYAIIKDPSSANEFVGVTVTTSDSAWQPGMVKAEFYNYEPKYEWYRGMYYQRDFSGMLNGFTLNDNRLDHWFGPSWYRVDSTGSLQKASDEKQKTVEFRSLNDSFAYLKLGKFNQEDVDKLDGLIKANRAVIYKTRNLIIDLRGNPGGDASSSQEMIQLIYTNPIVYPAWQYRSSPELIKAKNTTVAELSKSDPYNLLKSQQRLLQRLTEQPGKLVTGGDSIIRRADSIARYPEHVAFLIDGGSGSSAEFFTFEGKQSKKVTLFGANTFGVMDYGEDQSFNLSCGQYVVSIPWGRNGWIERFGFRIDNVGFKPDVPIPTTEMDWIQFVMRYWSK